MVRKLLIVATVVLALSLASMFLPARQMNIEGIGRLSFETKITLSVGSEVAYAAPDITTNSPTANLGGWTNPTYAYAYDANYASVMSGTPSENHTYYNYGFNLTGNTINQVRVRYDAWCAGSIESSNQQKIPTGDGSVSGTWTATGAQTRVPTADADISGTWNPTPSSPATRWDKVDETTPNDADYMTGTTNSGGYMLFTFPAFSVPVGSTITNLTVYIRAADVAPAGTNNIRERVKVNGSYYNGTTSHNPGTTPTTYSYAWTTNPNTFSPWTVADINGTGTNPLQQIGVYSTDLAPDMNVYMVYAQVNYTTTSRYTAVDETTPDDSDYITGVTNSGGYCLFTFSPFSVPAGATITNLTIYYRARDAASGTSNNIRSALQVGGTVYNTTDPGSDPVASFSTYSYAYTTNPRTPGVAWTVADINGTGTNPLQQFGAASNDLNPDVNVSMVYAQVNYTTTVYDEQIRVDVSWDGGFNWSSQQITTLTGSETTYWYNVTGETNWTPDKLSDANFRVRVDAYTQGTASEVRLDWIPVEVKYTPPGAAGWLCGWSYRQKLTIDQTKVDADLTDFPVLVKLTSSNFDFSKARSDGYDIRFTSSNGTTLLSYERERHNSTNQVAEYWVKIPSVSGTVNTDFYIYYGKSDATDGADPTNVWDSNFKMVQHLGENSTVVHDSTLNSNDETNPPLAPPSPGYYRASYNNAGEINGCYSFSDNGTNGSRLQMAHSTSLDITDNITLEAFVYLNDKTDAKFIDKDDPFDIGGSGCYNLQQELRGGVPNLELQLDLGGWVRVSYDTYNSGEWLYLVGTYDRQTLRLYLNGVERATNSPQTAAIASRTINVALGNRADDVLMSYDLHGLLDEARISNTARSPEWIRASYESGRDDLILYGAGETFPADIENTPSEINFGSVAEHSPYWSWSKSSVPPTFPLSDNECLFTLTNNSNCPLNVSIRATNFSGGDNWTLGTPGWKTVRLTAYKSSDNSTQGVILANSDQDFIPSLGASDNKSWEILLETGTFSDYVQKTSTITLTATSA